MEQRPCPDFLSPGAADPEIAALGPWFHNLHLPGGRQTAPHHPAGGDFPGDKWRGLQDAIPADLTGWRVLDVGCNAGFYSFELAKRGARVTGIDRDPLFLRQARWAAGQLGLEDRVEFRQAQVYDLAAWTDRFDLVWFMGVFYHLRYPLLGLDLVAQLTTRLLVFQSLLLPGAEVADNRADHDLFELDPLHAPGWPKLAFVEHRVAGDPTNWWIPNVAGVEALLRASGLRIVRRLPHEIYLCAPDPDQELWLRTARAQERAAATGQPPPAAGDDLPSSPAP